MGAMLKTLVSGGTTVGGCRGTASVVVSLVVPGGEP